MRPEVALPTIPGYRLMERIGKGGSGVVYRAEGDDDLGRPFAIKVFPPTGAGEYQRELETLRAIEDVRSAAGSRDLVEVVSAGEVEGFGYVVMEYVQGGTLEERLRVQGPLPAEEGVRLVRPVLNALALLHARGLIHKDVKPANVLVGDDGQPRLGDFGLARSINAPVSSAGTPGFCAPELYAGAPLPAGGAQVDVYSAAATLYYLLTGQAPLPGRPDLFLLERQRVDRGLQGVLFEALAEDPTQRIPTAEALGERLEAWSRGDLSRAGKAVGTPTLVLGAASLVLLLAALGVWLWPAPPAPPLWDGETLHLSGPAVTWSETGRCEVAGLGDVPALTSAPVAVAYGPRGRTLAAIGPWGETVALGLAGPEPRVLFRLGAAKGEGDPPLCTVAISGRHLVRMLVPSGSEPTRLEVYDLERGGLIGRLEGIESASALAISTLPGRDWPTVFVGTPDGRLVVLPDPDPERRFAVRTHHDEILGLAIDATRRLLVVGDDRQLQPAASLTGDDVRLEGGEQGLARRPQLRLKVYGLPLRKTVIPTILRELPLEGPIPRAALD